MGIKVTVKETEPVIVAFLTRKGPYTQIAAAFGQLYRWIGEMGYTPSGPPLGVYFNAPGQVAESELLWELRSPIAGKTAPAGPDKQGLGVKYTEKAQVATTMHKGPYENIGKTYEALSTWIAVNGYRICGPSEEVYFKDPATTPPAELMTEVRFPVLKK